MQKTQQFDELIKKSNKIEIPLEKGYRNLSEDTIFINKYIYTLSVNDNKRELIYKDNIFLILYLIKFYITPFALLRNGIEPLIFRSSVERFNHWATEAFMEKDRIELSYL